MANSITAMGDGILKSCDQLQEVILPDDMFDGDSTIKSEQKNNWE